MREELQRELAARHGCLPLWRTPWYLRWRGPWRMISKLSAKKWVYVTYADYDELFSRPGVPPVILD